VVRGKVLKNVFVGNLSFQTQESDLSELFKAFGQVGRVHIVMDRETGRARGFAFVEMPNDQEAANAIAGLDGKEFGGRNLTVNEARPRERSGSGGHDNRGGGQGRDGGRGRDYGGPPGQPRKSRW